VQTVSTRVGKREEAGDERAARAQHSDRRLAAALEGGKVEAGREDPGSPAQDDDGAGALALAQALVDLADHRRREGVHLARRPS
jgi:hypothetical protein